MGFYKIDNEILKYNRSKGNTKGEFTRNIIYTVICSNENYQRRDNILPRGYVKLSTRGLAEDVSKYTAKIIEPSHSTILRHLDDLESNGLISCVQKSNKKSEPSIYRINSNVNETDSETDYETENKTDKPRYIEGLSSINKTNIKTKTNTNTNTSKKEKQKNKEKKKKILSKKGLKAPNKLSYDNILDFYSSGDKELRRLLGMYLKILHTKGNVTNDTLKLNLNELDEYEGIEEKKKVMRNVVKNGWKVIYPIKEDNKKPKFDFANREWTTDTSINLDDEIF